MSIIQEALKKVEKAPGEQVKVADYAKNTKKRVGPALFLFIIFLIAAYFVATHPGLKSVYKPMTKIVAEPYQPPMAAMQIGPMHDLMLTGIVQFTSGPRAIINDTMVGVGDAVDGAKVVRIDKDGVVLQNKDREIHLNME